MARRVTVGPQNVTPFVKFGNFVAVFRQDRTNICSCCAVVYTFQVWWILTGEFLATLAATLTFILRVTSCCLACVYRRWCLQLQGKKKVAFYYEAVSISSSKTSEIVYQISWCHIIPPLFCRFAATEGKAWQTVITIPILLVEIRIWDLWNAKHPLQTVTAATFRKGWMSEIRYHYAW